MSVFRAIIIFLIFFTSQVFAQQGRFLLVGGGSEKTSATGWSVPAYKWAVQGKRVAVIGTTTGTLASYLTMYCGASFAKEFAIASRVLADSQSTFDTLVTYQVIFFRGGDQYNYYSLYKNTKLQQAAQQVFQNGGTIAGTSAGMHILSSVVFTAQYGTVYPHECIQNPTSSMVTLANDFMNFFPTYIFDTHFIERGRFGRLVGFLFNYKANQGVNLTGIGMDDMTCMTVDTDGIGTVYGTGAANIYWAEQPFQLNGTKLLNDAIKVTQLLQGCTFNFNTKQFTTPTLMRQIHSALFEETGNYIVLASGSNTLANNQLMLTDLVTNNGSATDPVLLLTGNEAVAETFRTSLLQAGASAVDIFLLNTAAGTNAQLTLKILNTTKILFVSNATSAFRPFLNTSNGELLRSKLQSLGMISAFVGDDSRFVGKTVVDNYYTEYAGYYGELTFSKGLALLRHSVIMPNTYFQTNMYENSAGIPPYAMVLDTLKFGIWLTDRNYMKIQPIAGKTTLTGYGSAPVMIVSNEGVKAGFSTQTGTGSSSPPRMVAGFEHLKLSLIDHTSPYVMGNTSTLSINKPQDKKLVIFPNPVRNNLTIKSNHPSFDWKIINSTSKVILQGSSAEYSASVNVGEVATGVYFVIVTHSSKGETSIGKLIKY